MKQIRFFAIICLLTLGAWRAPAQSPIAVQRLYFSFFNDYEADIFATNSVATNESSIIHKGLIGYANVDRALYLENGPLWTNYIGEVLVREVNLTNGAEGIYVRGNGRQTDVSQYFVNGLGPSYLGDFTEQVNVLFAALPNLATALPIHSGFTRFRPGYAVTNNLRFEKAFFASMSTTNMKFNFLSFGTAIEHPVVGKINGVVYSNQVESFLAHGVGTLSHTIGTNVFFQGAVPATVVFGPISGAVWTGAPEFIALTNGPE